MIKLYPLVSASEQDDFSLSSFLFGHRMRANQTGVEYLIEFLQVLLAKKSVGLVETNSDNCCDYFPILSEKHDRLIDYSPITRIGLKRFVFFPHSKPEGKALVDQKAYEACVEQIQQHISGSKEDQKQMTTILQNLFYGLSATTQSRSWFDKNLLPLCPEIILPEGMGVKRERSLVVYSPGNKDVDSKFSYTRYTYMCRGGEIYYLHLLDGINRCGAAIKHTIEKKFEKLLNDSYPQFSKLSQFIENTWDVFMGKDVNEVPRAEKHMKTIPAAFSTRSEMAALEIDTLLSNSIHPFDKLQILSDGIIIQLLRVMYTTASEQIGQKSAVWIMDLCKNAEMRKTAANAFADNEKQIRQYLYWGYAQLEPYLKDKKGNKEGAHIKDASNDTYKLYRKLGKSLGLIIPLQGPYMRFSLSERAVKFFVLSLVKPGQKVTLDMFLEMLNIHFGIVVDRPMYDKEIAAGKLIPLSDYSFLEENRRAMATLLKSCGFLRDLSDATAIVENPFDEEELDK